MDKRERAKEVLSWLIFAKKLNSQKELAELMGYSPTVVSSAMTGKIPLSSKLIKRICEMDERLNIDYIMEGKGEMLLNDKPKPSTKNIHVDTPGHVDKDLSDQMKTLMQSFAIESEKKENRIKELEKEVDELQELVTFLLKKGGSELLSTVLNSKHVSTAVPSITRMAK